MVHILADGSPSTAGKDLRHCDTAASPSHLHGSLSLSGAVSGLMTPKYPAASSLPSPTELSTQPATSAHGSSSGTAIDPGRRQQHKQAVGQRHGQEDGTLEGQLRPCDVDTHLAEGGAGTAACKGKLSQQQQQQQQQLTGNSPQALSRDEYGNVDLGKPTTPDEPCNWEDPEAGSLVVVTPLTPLTPHRADVRMEVEHGTELQLQPTTLGRGSFGRLLQGTYQGQVVAVKLVARAHATNTDALARVFAQEVEVPAAAATPTWCGCWRRASPRRGCAW